MTGDELASALYAEQGYLVYATVYPKVPGEVSRENRSEPGRSLCTIPLRIIEESNRDEFLSQVRLAAILTETNMDDFNTEFNHYYRVEAAD